MAKKNVQQKVLVDGTQPDEIRVAFVKGNELLDFDFENISHKPIKGNIYLGKIVRVEPSLQAAFVDFGRNKHGFLAFTEIHPDYFRIPLADRSQAEASSPKDENLLESSPQPDLGEEGGVEEPQHPGSASDIDTDEQPTSVDPTLTEEVEVLNEPSENSEALQDSPLEDKSSVDDIELKKKYALYRQYKLQEVIHSKQVVLIQVIKEERGNKGAALTTFISLAGRYSVLMPNSLHSGGISRKITEGDDRKRLKELVEDLSIPAGMSLIIRTAGLDRSKAEIRHDYEYLMNLWSQVREATLKAIAPQLIYEEATLIFRTLRDVCSNKVTEIMIAGENAFKEAHQFMTTLMPSHVKKLVAYHDEKVPLFQKHQIEQQIDQIYSPQVKLKSGGYLVINITEALIAIDVNSGRATRERHIDTTALKTNIEAAEEVARQIRIRDLSGLIVIDFIDMNEVSHNVAVENKLKEALSKDRARIQVGRISRFGLLEMSRQRLRTSLIESSSVKCPHCVGTGMIRSKESLCASLVRALRGLSLKHSSENPVYVKFSSDFCAYLLQEKALELSKIEEQFGKFFVLKIDLALRTSGFRIENQEGGILVDQASGPKEASEEKPEKVVPHSSGPGHPSPRRTKEAREDKAPRPRDRSPEPVSPTESHGETRP